MPQPPQEVPQPPKPPEIGREFELKLSQLVGVSLLALLVLLALFGVVGQSEGRLSAEGEVVALRVKYPVKLHYKSIGTVEVRVENTGDSLLETVTVRFDRSYVDSFSGVQFTPSAQEVLDQAYQLVLHDIGPGEAKLVSVEVRAEQFWRHRGYVEAAVEGEPARIELSTFTYP